MSKGKKKNASEQNEARALIPAHFGGLCSRHDCYALNDGNFFFYYRKI